MGGSVFWTHICIMQTFVFIICLDIKLDIKEVTVGRPTQPHIRDESLIGIIGYLLTYGCGDVSLGPMAAELRVSLYKLRYHFGSQAELLATAIAEAERCQFEAVRAWLEFEGSDSCFYDENLKCYWVWFFRLKNVPVFHFFIEIEGMAMRNLDAYSYVFREIFREGIEIEKQPVNLNDLRKGEAKAVTTVASAFIWCLQLGYLDTKDLKRTIVSLNLFTGLLDMHLQKLSVAEERGVIQM